MANPQTIKNGALHSVYPFLYGFDFDETDMDNRFASLLETHAALFSKTDAKLFSTAGRSELGGNHTDHNLGKVIAATINLDTIAAVSPRNDTKVVLISEGYPAVEVDLSNLGKVSSEENTTQALVRGIGAAFSKRGLSIGGWEANTTSRVLKGSGLSSSAAIEILCGTIFNHLYNEDVLTPVELAIIGKFSENEYFGKPSGLMDQIACANGGIVGIDFRDGDNPVVVPVPFSFSQHGYALAIVDTGGNHADLTPEYAAVPKEMRLVAAQFGKENLRQISKEEFEAKLPQLRATLNNDRALLRAIHFYSENERVSSMVTALQKNDFPSYLALVKASGESSFCFLQNLYPASNPKEQGLSLAIALTRNILGEQYVARVHGGGFAGTIQAYVPLNKIQSYTKSMETVFGKGSVTAICIRQKPTCCIAE
ncbi:galactokinase [Sphaerochaeta pleomorpha str. Grapes]|uniref:Galactokinase n=1 Tax=Sphaerochaeta pleomorpha (strain ATCC BAA-1885 / DSM 22778 / Grapes) TaxID=158190 RepID=G8QSZ9_SPHPG|nr:galactokinase family protein [Sphaerochaeta pleomorpha]AEV27904.1 galactokinase [Sphaerochaeta pleomorpha str. Grapes]